MTKELNFTASFSLALQPPPARRQICRWMGRHIGMHGRTRTRVSTYARRHARFIPCVSVSESRLTGNVVSALLYIEMNE